MATKITLSREQKPGVDTYWVKMDSDEWGKQFKSFSTLEEAEKYYDELDILIKNKPYGTTIIKTKTIDNG